MPFTVGQQPHEVVATSPTSGEKASMTTLPPEVCEMIYKYLMPRELRVRVYHIIGDPNYTTLYFAIEILNNGQWQDFRSARLVSREWNNGIVKAFNLVGRTTELTEDCKLEIDIISHLTNGEPLKMPAPPAFRPSFASPSAANFLFTHLRKIKLTFPIIGIDITDDYEAKNDITLFQAELTRYGFQSSDHQLGELTLCINLSGNAPLVTTSYKVLKRDRGFAKHQQLQAELSHFVNETYQVVMQKGLTLRALVSLQHCLVNLQQYLQWGDEDWVVLVTDEAVNAVRAGRYHEKDVDSCVDQSRAVGVDGVYTMKG